MRHATPATLHAIGGFLQELRACADLRERKLGVFYRKSRAFLHFHEHGDQIFADVRFEGSDFERHEVTSPSQQAALLERISAATAGAGYHGPGAPAQRSR